MSNFPSVTIDKFLGLNETDDVFGLKTGEFTTLRNYDFLPNGGIEERGGGAKLTGAPTVGSVIYGLGNYLNDSGANYLICAQGTDLYYYDSGWNALGLALTSSQKTRFELGGFGSNRALYAVNGADSIQEIKMSGAAPAASTLSGASIPTDGTSIKNHKNRMFVASGDTLYFSDVLAYDWTSSPSNIQIAPGVDGFIQSLEVWGDALFIFKETGVYVLPNASDSSPGTNWVILRADALTGTLSPDTVRRTKVGIMYLATDNKVRLIAPNISYSTGEYQLGGSGSPSVSEALKIADIIDNGNKTSAVAVVKGDQYILSFNTSENNDSYNDKTYFCDTSKFISYDNIPVAQPLWGEYTNFDYGYYVPQTDINNNQLLYGAKDINGDIQETLNKSTSNDDGVAIDAYAVLGWLPIAGEPVYVNAKQIYMEGYTENWDINLKFQGYHLGRDVPNNGDGKSATFSAVSSGAAIVGTATVGTAMVGSIGVGTKKYRLGQKGHYFRVEFGNSNADQPHNISKLIIYYRNKRQR